MAPDSKLSALAERWRNADHGELANAQLYITELCEALGVEKPRPSGTGYEFEYSVRVVHRDGTDTVNRVDLFKEGHFLLEAKDEGDDDGVSAELRRRRAFGQASAYAAFVPGGPPPYLMVLDVPHTLRVWDRWSGSYGGFQGAVRTIDLKMLAERPGDADFLRSVWGDPESLNPNVKAEAVTKEIAEKLATLAARLEGEGEDQERVARFLIRCVFTMFAEDIGLLEEEPFRRAVEMGMEDPARFEKAMSGLWAAMDAGGDFGLIEVMEFDGHFFQDQDVIPLEHDDLAVLLEAARADWAHVEPSIFGTLLTRALDKEERHRLGAEFTPRAYVERLVRPTIEEPVRERWTMVQAEVLQLREKDRKSDVKKAIKRLRQFHDELRSIRILDPACGSGNFLYVSLSILKEIELEVIRELESITGQRETALDEVSPAQFHGIEVKLWAREVAELCLWVGHHQWWRRTHGHAQPPEPILQNTGTLEHRDAVLAWDEVREMPDDGRPDPTPRIEDPVTGELVPDPDARLPYFEYVGAKQAEWPKADFIVGNPPYIGGRRMRESLGEGYTDALRSAYPDVPDGADLVMHWWYRAANLVAEGTVERAGLITTNSIVQKLNRPVVAAASDRGASVIWAIPDHPWVDEQDGADVRVAMTVIAQGPADRVRRVEVDEQGKVVQELENSVFNADLSVTADVSSASAEPLLANKGLSHRGMIRRGQGFLVEEDEASKLIATLGQHARDVLRPIYSGRDLAQGYSGRFAVDFGLRSESEARAYPVLFDLLRERVKPKRQGKKEARAREIWWQFWNPRADLRESIAGLSRFVATPYVSKHRFFRTLPTSVIPDDMLVVVAVNNHAILGVLNSAIHTEWALAAGSRLGVGNDPRYNNAACFDSFPFPDLETTHAASIADCAISIESHLDDVLARAPSITVTSIYNVVQKLTAEEPLTARERQVYETAACGVFRDRLRDLDRLTARAYEWDWPLGRLQILERLVALHSERRRKERMGNVAWLRPDYQIPRFGDEVQRDRAANAQVEADILFEPELPDWPSDSLDQLSAVRETVMHQPLSVEEVARRFKGARRSAVEEHLSILAAMGIVSELPEGRYQAIAGVHTVDQSTS